MPDLRSDRRRTPRRLAAVMVLSVGTVGVLAWWDEQREAAAALEDFGQEQSSIAASVGKELESRLHTGVSAPGTVTPTPDLLVGLGPLERPGEVEVFLASPDGRLLGLDGRETTSRELAEALASGRSRLRLAGPAAAALGLPPRTAMAGLARTGDGRRGSWGVAVVASAARERNREQRGRLRLVLTATLAAGLVVGFGGFALREQRRELELGRELAVAEVAHESDERLAKLNRAATMVTLATGVAHEVSTPLGVIAGRAEQLQSRLAGDSRCEQPLRVIVEQTDRIKQIIRGLLELARGGSPTLEDVSPAQVVRGAVGLVDHRFRAAGVWLRTSVAESLPLLRCDPHLLEQALVNLLLNACDASPEDGEVVIAVSADAGTVTFAVTDEGAGIPEAHAARVAEPFFTTKAPGKGTGLGLAITSEIAKTHRGSLALSPASPRGTRAVLAVPIAAGETHAESRGDRSASAVPTRTGDVHG